MRRYELRRRVARYLSAHGIAYKEHFNDQLYLWYNMEAPGGIESDIRIVAEDKLSIRCYYSDKVSKALREKNSSRVEVLKVLNYINAEVIEVEGVDIIPRMYMDGRYDIVLAAELPLKLDFNDIMQYSTVFIPKLMELLAPALCGVALGLYPASAAIWQIRTDVLKEDDAVVEEFY